VHLSRSELQQAGTPLFKAAGWVEPRPTPIRVAALAPGVIDKLPVVEDQQLATGDPVAVLIDQDARLALQADEANLKLRNAELERAKAELVAARTNFEKPVALEAELADAEAQLAKVATQLANLPYELQQAEARLRFAKGDYEGKLEAKDALSGRAIDLARSDFESASAQVEQCKRRTSSLQTEAEALSRRRDSLREKLSLKTEQTRLLAEAEADLKAALAKVDQASVAVEEAKLTLDRMTVRAPVGGRVLQLIADPGTRLMLNRGHSDGHDASTVITMYQPGKLQVRVDVRFEDVPHVEPGAPVLIESPALAATLQGEVLFLSSLVDIQKNTLQVKVGVDEPPVVLKPEMLVDVTFLAPEKNEGNPPATSRNHIYAPKQLVRQGEDGPYIWVADQTNKIARRTSVRTGTRGTRELIEIVDGLSMSSRLIATPPAGLRDSERITIVGEDSTYGVGPDSDTPNEER
jgi:multidrug efflux pump subunit AcrA (membrane-fusion protein)